MKASVLLALAALFYAGRLCADTQAPAVPSASVSPSSVDVTAGPQTVTITLRATDGESGVDFGNSYLFDEVGHMVSLDFFSGNQRTSGNESDGIYSITMNVPRYARPGLWRVDTFIRDHAGNQVDFSPNGMQFPISSAMKFTVVNSGQVDTGDPEVVASAVSPGTVSVTEGDAEVTVTATVTDDLSGFDFGFLTLKSPDGGTEVSTYFSPDDLDSGTANNGVYGIVATVPQGSPAGVWTYHFSLKDEVGNTKDTGQMGTFTVVSAPPAPRNSEFLADAVEAVGLPWSTSGGGWVMQTLESSDGEDAASNLAIPDGGTATVKTTVSGAGELSFKWRVDSQEDQDFLSVSVDGGPALQSISGNTAWSSFSITLPAGEHTVEWTYAKDGSGSAGADRGYLDRVRFLRDVDTELPVLQSLDISPRLTNLTVGPQEVEFRIAVTDDHHGVSQCRLALFDPSGTERISTLLDGGLRTGTPVDGYWVVNMEIPTDFGFGMWRAKVELTEDVTNQTRLYGAGGESFPLKESDAFYAGDPDAPDTDAPRVQALSVTPGTVDISTGMSTAWVTVQITDAIRGFAYGDIPVNNPDQNWTGTYPFDDTDRIKGDEFNGIYQVQISIPAYGKSGKWTIGGVVTDYGGNRREYPTDIPFSTGLDPSFQVTNTGVVDNAAPLISSIDITPAVVSAAASPVPVQVTLSVSDNLSGLLQGFAYFFDPADEFQNSLFVDLSGHRISGTAAVGTYQFSVTLPQGSAAGLWRVRVFLRDAAGNAVYFGENAAAYPETGDGRFTVTGAPASVLAAYIAGFSLTGNNALPSADPDHDGLNNAIETLLGTNPATATTGSAGLISSGRDATNFYLNFTIASGLTATANGDFLELRNGSGGPPLRVTGQTQAGLSGSWTNVLPVSVGGANYRVSIPLANGAKGFLRLHLEDP